MLKTPGRTIVLKDDGEMQQYVYMGDLKNSSMALVHELEPNTEEYYFINKRTGTVDTLVGPPVFYPNTMNIVCLEGMNTDVKQRIQVGKIVDGRFRMRFYLRIKGEINPGYVYWADVHTLFLNDNNEKFYKLTF
ncbi:MAG: hypothetical protein JST19_02375 [Bacteroidetes bacterium]|nr:hypothetical protein [Bacteroidota bacterium]